MLGLLVGGTIGYLVGTSMKRRRSNPKRKKNPWKQYGG